MTRKLRETSNTENVVNTAEMDFDRMLLSVGQTHDKQAFAGLFAHFAPRVKSYLMRGGMNPESADELAQETMLTVWDKAASFDPKKAAASTWIFTIARNKKIDTLRKKNQPHVDVDDLDLTDDKEPTPQAQAMRLEEMKLLGQAIRKLPGEQADLLYKSFFEDKTHSEIAAETGIALGTVKSRIRLALERLRGEQGIKELWQ
jgi:RNA polymerase sigma factor (sigma-70 family)